MPHKHKRKPNERGDYDLPPSAKAQALEVGKKRAAPKGQHPAQQPSKRARKNDDTPKAFQRIMAQQQGARRPSGLDNGDAPKPSKKRKGATARADKPETKPKPVEETATELSIQPGERLSDFNARVNQALPLAGLSKQNKKIDGMKEKQTRIEKKIQRKIKAWREEEERRKERAEEERDEQDLEDAADFTVSEGAELARQDKKKRGKPGDDSDPWARLRKERGKRASLHDVAQAPPDLKKPTAKFKVKSGAAVDVVDVPASAGSLRKREALGSERRDIIERYRQLMQDKRGSNMT